MAAIVSARFCVAAPPLAHRFGRRGATTTAGAARRRSSVASSSLLQSSVVRHRRAASVACAASTSSDGAAAGEKVCVITGANTGLGFISAGEIAERPGYRVVMACRDPSRGEKAAEEVRARSGRDVDVMKLDLADLQSVDAFVEEFTAGCERPDYLSLRFPPSPRDTERQTSNVTERQSSPDPRE